MLRANGPISALYWLACFVRSGTECVRDKARHCSPCCSPARPGYNNRLRKDPRRRDRGRKASANHPVTPSQVNHAHRPQTCTPNETIARKRPPQPQTTTGADLSIAPP
ncbi:hypothetical protein KCP78_18195 [Salmonella enterica subsp. enterica]|nr:hypothetical protein KCP78_18195 [Salmonella enterica subsp. enterica]